jgi:hypothetical protein
MDIEEVDNLDLAEALEHARTHRRHGPNAYLLLVHLRDEYADLRRDGGTFKVTPKVCARTGEPYKWTRERYENTRNVQVRQTRGPLQRMTANGLARLSAKRRGVPLRVRHADLVATVP